MNPLYKYVGVLRDLKGIPNEQVIADIVADSMDMGNKAKERYDRYKQEEGSTPILTRTFDTESANKINNKLANDFFGEIVDTKVGYMFGLPVASAYDKKAKSYEIAVDTMDRFKKRNDFDDLNAELCKFAAICGYSAALCYIDREGHERVRRVDPWEAAIISKTSITEPEFGVIYYETWDKKKRAEFFNNTTKYVFEGPGFSANELKLIDTKTHMFKYCPLYGIPNNEELQGDGDKVFSLIDAYDRSTSDMNSEIEQFRLAYMIFIGYAPDEEDLEKMRRTGALYIPESDEGEDIKWLIKDLKPDYVDSHLDRLESNITRFAKHVNFTEAFGGGQVTGPAMRYKLFMLEAKSKYFERKHEASTLYLFKVIGSSWNVKFIPFDYTLLDFVYNRNIPVNLIDEANAATTLSGIASLQTALATLSIVDDVDEEMKRIKAERDDEIDLDDPKLLKGNPDDPNDPIK